MLARVERDRASPVEATAPRPGVGLPLGVPVVVALAWALLVAGETGAVPMLDHDAVLAGGRIRWPAVAGFLLGWEAW